MCDSEVQVGNLTASQTFGYVSLGAINQHSLATVCEPSNVNYFHVVHYTYYIMLPHNSYLSGLMFSGKPCEKAQDVLQSWLRNEFFPVITVSAHQSGPDTWCLHL
jgi:hypothetical protein